MNKIFLTCLSAFLFALAGCAEKSEYKEAIAKQMSKEQDIKDYHLDPEEMTDCIFELSSQKMPGFSFAPERLQAYHNYSVMLTLNESEHPEELLKQLRKDFGSPQALADAHSNYMESEMECIAGVLAKVEQDDEDITRAKSK